MKAKVIVLTTMSSLLLSSCATLYSGMYDTIHITSVPSGAKVEINGKEKGVTPFTTVMKRSVSKKRVSLSLEGYKKKTFDMPKKFNKLAILDIPTVVGGLIDVASGAITPYKYRYYEEVLKSKDNPNEKIVKSQYYNYDDNFWVITHKGDTIYTEPFSQSGFLRIYYKPIGGSKKSLKDDEVFSFKSIYRNNISIKKGASPYTGVEEARPYWPEKKPDQLLFMSLLMKDGEYSLLHRTPLKYDLTYTHWEDDEYRFYIFKGKEFVKHLKEDSFHKDLNEYFPNCKKFLKLMREKNYPLKKLTKVVEEVMDETHTYIKPDKKKKGED